MKLTARPRIGQENRQRPTLRNVLMDIDLNWKDAVESDLKALRVGDWRMLARNRCDWRNMLEEAKTNKRL